MGSYTDLSVDGYPVLETKSSVVPEVMTIFRETDKRIFTRRVSERNELVWGKPDIEVQNEVEPAILYTCQTDKIIDRLNVMGFTFRRVREDFNSTQRLELEKIASWAEDDENSDWFAEKWAFLKGLKFDDYADGLRTVMANSLRAWPFEDRNKEGIDSIVKYILGENEDYHFGFIGSDLRSFVRLACELADVNSEVVQDLTELVSAGYYAEEEPVCNSAIMALTKGHPENSPRIILTEGSTDAAILRDALDLLYPHLSEYYTFFDFDSSRSQGGAGHLVAIVKAFAAAGITNRVIALFDNDTAAFEARQSLDSIIIPSNIAILSYPALDFLKTYPTVGPGGPSKLDVNGLAGSLELYLGQDVLAEANAENLAYVQWKGYSERLGKYQGEVMHKSRIQDEFRRKVKRCRSDPEAIASADWSGLRAILKRVFNAFE